MPLENFANDFLNGRLDGNDLLKDHGYNNSVDIAQLCGQIEDIEGVCIHSGELHGSFRLNDLSAMIAARREANLRWKQTFSRSSAPTMPFNFSSAF